MANNLINKKVKDLLETANVCQRCILRFLGEKEYTSYVSKINVDKVVLTFYILLNYIKFGM